VAHWSLVRLRRRNRVGTEAASGVGHGEAAKLPDYMLDFDSWRRHRAETASAPTDRSATTVPGVEDALEAQEERQANAPPIPRDI
jgi:hypothetical protein